MKKSGGVNTEAQGGWYQHFIDIDIDRNDLFNHVLIEPLGFLSCYSNGNSMGTEDRDALLEELTGRNIVYYFVLLSTMMSLTFTHLKSA